MKRKAAEVVIVGAGPAGAALGLQLARRGRDVLILERSRFPRDKPCGDCVNPGAVAELVRLGVKDSLLRSLRPYPLKGWRVESPDGRFFQAAFDREATGNGDQRLAWAVRRREFDAALLAEAQRAGARVNFQVRVYDLLRENGRVVGVLARDGTSEREIHSRVVVGADGLGSVVQRRLRLTSRSARLRKLALVGHLREPIETTGFGELRVRNGRSCGFAPLAGGGNVTLVLPTSEAAAVAGRPLEFLAVALRMFPELAARVAPVGLENSVSVTGPFDRPVRRPWSAGAVLIGDAAGYYDPFTGQGIHQALRSASLAAPAIDAALGDPSAEAAALRRYGRQLRLELAPTRVLQRIIEGALNRPRVMSRFIDGLAFDDSAAAWRLLRVTGDLAHPLTLLDPSLWLRLATGMLLASRSAARVRD